MEIELSEITVHGYEKVVKATHAASGLLAIIAIHNTVLGPALGGTRIFPYSSFDEALDDVLRLSKGMTHKSSMAGMGLGGGKSVIIADPKTEKTPELLHAFGEVVNTFEGMYICAEDVGCTTADVAIINEVTPFVTGLEHDKSSGNPSPFTAWGTYRGIQAVCEKIYGDRSVKGRRIAIQGMGSVGQELAKMLFWEGGELIITDIDKDKAARLGHQFGAEVVGIEDIIDVECDIFAPCALGGIINDETIPRFRCKAIAGCANNQLLEDRHADALDERDILYAPDFVINAGGLINVSCEIHPLGYQAMTARDQTDVIYDRLLQVFDVADQEGCSPHAAAIDLAEQRIDSGAGKRTEAPQFHHSAK